VDLQAKHSDGEFLEKMDEAWRYLTGKMGSDPARTACIGHGMGRSAWSKLAGSATRPRTISQ
jgi:hypothetical protein